MVSTTQHDDLGALAPVCSRMSFARDTQGLLLASYAACQRCARRGRDIPARLFRLTASVSPAARLRFSTFAHNVMPSTATIWKMRYAVVLAVLAQLSAVGRRSLHLVYVEFYMVELPDALLRDELDHASKITPDGLGDLKASPRNPRLVATVIMAERGPRGSRSWSAAQSGDPLRHGRALGVAETCVALMRDLKSGWSDA